MSALEKATEAVEEKMAEILLSLERGVVVPDRYESVARAVLMAVREPGIDVGLVGAEQVNIQMRGPTKADYCAAQDAFTAMIDAILNEGQT